MTFEILGTCGLSMIAVLGSGEDSEEALTEAIRKLKG